MDATFRHSECFRVVLPPEAGAGLVCRVDEHDCLVWGEGGMGCIHERLCVRRACFPRYDDLAEVTCMHSSRSADCLNVDLPSPNVVSQTRMCVLSTYKGNSES